MKIIDLAAASNELHIQAARMLVEEFQDPGGWDSLEEALVDVQEILTEGFARGLIFQEQLAGWVGGLPEYDGHVWELHPLVVRGEFRRRGFGRALVDAFEAEATRRGALTFTLGTDDNTGITSLAGTDLYTDLPRKIQDIRDLGRSHPFLFYQKLGYTITGVMPDANGPGLPDIYMSKPAGKSRSAGAV